MTLYRADFPIFSEKSGDKHRWTYLDSAATTQKPRCMIEAIVDSYTHCNANVHRGVYKMSREATERHEQARRVVTEFIGASSAREVLFTRGTTESLNIIATCYGSISIEADSEIIITQMEHHANLVPWQQLCLRQGAHLRVAKIHPDGSLDMEHFRSLLSNKTRIVAVAHVSNVLGTVNPIQEIIDLAHSVGAIAVIDGAQAVAHMPVNVQELGADFYVFSAHKLYGPTGMGILWGREEHLLRMPPYQMGGEMIERVTFECTTFNDLPYKFEAGTPDFIGSHAFATSIKYVQEIGLERIHAYEKELLEHATKVVESFTELTILGTAKEKAGVVTFVCNKAHAYDLGLLLDEQGVAIRTGHHCAQPLIELLGHNATLRLSLGLYNNHEDIESFERAMKRALSFF